MRLEWFRISRGTPQRCNRARPTRRTRGRTDMSGAVASPTTRRKHRRRILEELEAAEGEERVACLWQQMVALSLASRKSEDLFALG